MHYLLTFLRAWWFMFIRPRYHPLTVPDYLGTRHTKAGIPIIQLEGSAYERGFQHGYQCRTDLTRFQTIAWQYAPRTATQRLGIPALAAKLLIRPLLFALTAPYIQRAATDIKAEIQGIADGAQLDVREVALLAVIWDIFAMFPAQPAAHHCSEVAFDQTVSRGPLLGYNYDVLVPDDRLLVEGFLALFVVKPDQGSAYVTPNTMGSVGLNSAMNVHGVAFGWDNSYLRAEMPKGVNKNPYMLVLRDIALTCRSLQDVWQHLQPEERQEADISVIADATAVGVVELAQKHAALRSAAAVWSCNRLQELEQFDYLGSGKAPDGRSIRYAELIAATLNEQPVTAIEVAAILRDTTTTYGRAIASAQTTFTVIYDTARLQLWLSFAGAPASVACLRAFDFAGNRLPDQDIEAARQP